MAWEEMPGLFGRLRRFLEASVRLDDWDEPVLAGTEKNRQRRQGKARHGTAKHGTAQRSNRRRKNRVESTLGVSRALHLLVQISIRFDSVRTH